MKDFMVKAILEPFLAILFCLAFGLPFTYVGFQDVNIELKKDNAQEVTLDFRRKHYWGLILINEHLEKVENATRKTELYRRKSKRHFLGTGVFSETATEATRLIAGSSNVNDEVKLEMVRTINGFIDDPISSELNLTYRINNLFGWFGLPFLILGFLGLIGWPFSIYKHWKEK